MNVRHELSQNVTPRVIRANHYDFSAPRLSNAHAELFGALPNHLGELTTLDHSPRFLVEGVLLHLLVPRPADVFGARFGVSIRRPQTIQILAVLGILPVGEPIVPRQNFRPLLRIPDQFLVQTKIKGLR